MKNNVLKLVGKWAVRILILAVVFFAALAIGNSNGVRTASAELSCDQAVSDAKKPVQDLLDQANAAKAEIEGKLDKENAAKDEIQGKLNKTLADLASAVAANATLQQKQDQQTQGNDNSLTYDYVPGGPNYSWPHEDSVEEISPDLLGGQEGWTRIRRAANGDYLPWTALVRITANSPLEEVAQWDSATKLLIANPTSAEITVLVEIRRDLLATVEGGETSCMPCTPYEVANFRSSPLGLGWFITGNGAEIVVSDTAPVVLTGLGVKQMSFPKDWDGVWVIKVTLKPYAQVTFNQGERLTSVDTWPLPIVVP